MGIRPGGGAGDRGEGEAAAEGGEGAAPELGPGLEVGLPFFGEGWMAVQVAIAEEEERRRAEAADRRREEETGKVDPEGQR